MIRGVKNSEDRERLKKLGVETIADLALLLPNRYENYTLNSHPILSSNNLIEATITSTSYNPKYMKITLNAKNYQRQMNGIIFNPRKYHFDKFKSGANYYLYGKIDQNYNTLNIVQPLIIDSEYVGKIVPKYKSKIQSRTVIKLMDKYLTKEKFLDYGVDEEIWIEFEAIHSPTLEFLQSYEKRGEFSTKTVEAIKYLEIYNYLKKLSKKKIEFPAKKALKGDIEKFLDSLPFELTGDQQKAIKDIEQDLVSTKAAKRVVMGDVGSGKSMVIFASAFIAYPNRSILMAPTTILANQLYNEAKKFLPSDMKITLVTNSTKEEDLSPYHFIIGTHALLHRELPDVDLVMVDEQHRFGTKQRALIAKLVSQGERQPHYLQFSATPIPRTLSMIQSSIVDITQIKEIPFEKDIETKIITKSDFRELLEHIEDQIEADKQTIIVYPLVEESEAIEYQSIDEARGFWEKRYENVFVTYGKDKEKEEVVEKFRDEGDILIATTLVEVGISLPRLSTIILVAPERLGLATLHQLRGRVSRHGDKGYCFLMTKQPDNKRLKEFCKTTDGFKIAELDLKFRESGDLLKGDQQSGKVFKYLDLESDGEIIAKAKRDLSL